MQTVNGTNTCAIGSFRWQVAPQHRDNLLDDGGLRLQEWLRRGSARIVKHGPHRTVYRVVLPNLDFYLKHYRLADKRSWLRQLVRPAKARIEYDRTLAIAARGVPTAQPLAVGERHGGCSPGESYLLTHTLHGTMALGSYIATALPLLPARQQVRIRQCLARELARLLAHMHDMGITHHDLHAGNILVRVQDEEHMELFLIDLHAVSIGQALDWAASRKNLVMFNRWFSLRAERTDRLRFWQEYCRCRSAKHGTWSAELKAASSALINVLEQETDQSNLRFWRGRDGRCLNSNRYYQRVHSEELAGHAVRDLDERCLEALVKNPDAFFEHPGVRLLKDSRSATVAELELSIAGVPRCVILKRFHVTAWTDPWAALVRRTPALRSWIHGQGLRERGLPTARPLAVLQRRKHGMWQEGYLLTEKVPDSQNLRTFIDSLGSLSSPERRTVLRRQIAQIACLVRELHRRGLAQRDLKAANILMSPERCPWSLLPWAPAVNEQQAWLIDLVGITVHGHVSDRRRIQNLARLHASFHRHPLITRADKLRFLRRYLPWGVFARSGWKRWWRALDQATQVKIARNLRSGRPLA